jgi:hypothetical protein
MSIAIHVHANDPSALAELIATTMRPEDGVVLDREPPIAHFAALVQAEEREATLRRDSWHWLNSISKTIDHDNDWSMV